MNSISNIPNLPFIYLAFQSEQSQGLLAQALRTASSYLFWLNDSTLHNTDGSPGSGGWIHECAEVSRGQHDTTPAICYIKVLSDIEVCLQVVELLVCHSEILLYSTLIGNVLAKTTFPMLLFSEMNNEEIRLVWQKTFGVTPTISSVIRR